MKIIMVDDAIRVTIYGDEKSSTIVTCGSGARNFCEATFSHLQKPLLSCPTKAPPLKRSDEFGPQSDEITRRMHVPHGLHLV